MYAIYKGNIYCMQYTVEYILYTMYIAFDKIWQYSTKCDKTMSKIVDDKKNRSLDKIQQYICI